MSRKPRKNEHIGTKSSRPLVREIANIRIFSLCFVSAHDYGPNCHTVEQDLPVELLLNVMKQRFADIVGTHSQLESLTQGSPEWLDCRRNLLTASNFSKVVRRKVSNETVCMFVYSLSSYIRIQEQTK